MFFPHSEGYVNVTEGEYFNYVYNYTDHLGNIRVSFGLAPESNELKILEENHYYPFGLKHANYNVDKNQYSMINNIPQIVPALSLDYKYKYNGKEFQDELGLNVYDFGARNYDAALGRWFNIDPLADLAYDKNPYHYVSNNPINRFDPDGLTDYTLNKKTGELKVVEGTETTDGDDRIVKSYQRGKKEGQVKTNKDGESRVAIDNVEKGILANGQNWKTQNQHIDVGGDGQPSKEGVQSFTLKLSEHIGKELKGFSYSSDGSGKITDMTIGKYEKNSYTRSSATVSTFIDKYGSNYSNKNIFEVFHTHPDGKLGATQSHPELSLDVKNLQRNKPNVTNAIFYIIYRIQGQTKPGIYDYTHEYVEPKKK
ncbi:MAG: RHS repeat-associated core domain-containing protein [Flavobacterium sp.]|nr:RHS repeat-associated core domain-containing protein [Flavobacterium sp.]